MRNKLGVAVPFSWIFALIVGGFILFIALFVANRVIQTGEQSVNVQTATQIITLLQPFETGIASGKSTILRFRKPTRVAIECRHQDNDPFGRQTISISEQTFGDRFSELSLGVPFTNKYIFSDDLLEGTEYYVFSKPFFLPFSVGDLTIIDNRPYCIIDAPNEVKRELSGLQIPGVNFIDSGGNGFEKT